MQVLKILSDIWKSGANIYLDEKDGRIAIDKQNLIPVDVMKNAENNFTAIDSWFKSWVTAGSDKLTTFKVLKQFCGWQHNEKLNEWLCNDEESLLLFYDWSVVLAKNGWTDIYEDYRPFENKKSNEMAHELYKRAIGYVKNAKKEGMHN